MSSFEKKYFGFSIYVIFLNRELSRHAMPFSAVGVIWVDVVTGFGIESYALFPRR